MASQSNLDGAKLNQRVVAGKRPDKAPAIGAVEFANPNGDLAGTQADPFVIAIHLSDGTRLSIDGVGTGQVLQRVGPLVSGLTLGVLATAAAGYSGTITTAKLTALGSDGSMTFTNGVLTAQTAAT